MTVIATCSQSILVTPVSLGIGRVGVALSSTTPPPLGAVSPNLVITGLGASPALGGAPWRDGILASISYNTDTDEMYVYHYSKRPVVQSDFAIITIGAKAYRAASASSFVSESIPGGFSGRWIWTAQSGTPWFEATPIVMNIA